jgi:hypothetical protein
MHVAHADALFVQVFGQVLGHALGQRRGQHAEPFCAVTLPDLVEQVVDLHLDGADLHLRVQKAGGADHLFGEDAARLLQFPIGRGGGDEDDCGRIASHSSNFSGRLSMQDGRRNPCSASVNFRR